MWVEKEILVEILFILKFKMVGWIHSEGVMVEHYQQDLKVFMTDTLRFSKVNGFWLSTRWKDVISWCAWMMKKILDRTTDLPVSVVKTTFTNMLSNFMVLFPITETESEEFLWTYTWIALDSIKWESNAGPYSDVLLFMCYSLSFIYIPIDREASTISSIFLLIPPSNSHDSGCVCL